MGEMEIEIAGHKFTIQEQQEVYDAGTGRALTGSWVWYSALVLSHFLGSQDLKGKSVLELGAGAGLPGLAAAKLGASRVVLTDVEALLAGLLKNVEANGLSERVEVKELVWGKGMEGGDGREHQYDVVLMSDVLFDAEEMEGLARTLERVCGSSSKETTVWAASEVRPGTCECLHELVTRGFQVLELMSVARPHRRIDVEDGPGPGLENDGGDAYAVYQLVPPLLPV